MDAKTQRLEKLQVAERAAEWLCVLEEGGAQERAAFADWVSASPLHLKEFLFMSALDGEISRMDPQKKIAVEEILARAGKNVVRMHKQEEIPPKGSGLIPPKGSGLAMCKALHIARPDPLERRGRTRWIMVIAATLACVAAVAWWMLSIGGQTYETAVGEQRRLELADGSIVQLSTASRVKVRFSDQARELVLLSGEAMFKVERDAKRPFRVHSDTSVIQAIGTQFNVLRRPSGTTVSVLEGVVRVSEAKAPPTQDKTLVAGDEIRIDRTGRVQKRKTPDITTAKTWRSDRLVFRDDTLEDIAAEFNRYNSNAQITLATEEIRNRRYTAVFDANDPRSLVEFLRQDAGLAVEQHASDILVRAASY